MVVFFVLPHFDLAHLHCFKGILMALWGNTGTAGGINNNFSNPAIQQPVLPVNTL